MVRIDEAARLDWSTEELGAHWDELKLGSMAVFFCVEYVSLINEPFLKSSWKRFKPLPQKLHNYQCLNSPLVEEFCQISDV